MSPWTPTALPDLRGRTALVTGANSGIGLATTEHLARAGARVLLGCRSPERARQAVDRVRDAVPGADLSVVPLDLGDLDAVRRAADVVAADHAALDLLVTNAGIVLLPGPRTPGGPDPHLATNALGHFALTAHLLPLVLAAPAGRVVSVGSLQHRIAGVDHDDPHFDRRRYHRMRAYGQSKLVNVQLMVELDRRLRAAGARAISVGAHPGFAATGVREQLALGRSERLAPAIDAIIRVALNTNDQASWPVLRAATDPGLRGGEYFGPDRLLEVRGHPAPARLSRKALDPDAGRRTWEMAERLTGVTVQL